MTRRTNAFKISTLIMKRIQPTKEVFLESTQRGMILPLYAEIDRPGLTPLAALEVVQAAGHPVLLESARVHEKIGRYSFVTAEPYLIFRSTGETIELSLCR